MHLLIIILQQLLDMLPSGSGKAGDSGKPGESGKKAPQTEPVRFQGQAPRGCDPCACLSLPTPTGGWMIGYWMPGYSIPGNWMAVCGMTVVSNAQQAVARVVRCVVPPSDRLVAERSRQMIAVALEQGSAPILGRSPRAADAGQGFRTR